MIPYGKQDINQNDIDAVIAVLKSDFLTQGPQVPAFEESIMSITSVQNAVAVSSATAALHIACLALELGAGDLLWTTPNSFVASANCARYCGADVDFVDIDPKTYNLCPHQLEKKLANAERLPKVLVAVHFAGEPCDMKLIHQLAERYGVRIIEDASHAIGAFYENQPIGNCQYSDIAVFSFHPVKIITTAEGGIATTNDTELAQRMRDLRSHGVTRDTLRMTHPTDGAWYYQQIELGFNYRMTELQAALGVSQLVRLEEFIEARHIRAARYDTLLTQVSDRTTQVIATQARNLANKSALHLYPIEIKPEYRKPVFDSLRAESIGVNVHYIPIHIQPYYQALGFAKGDFPAAENYYAGTISLPLHPGLTEAEQSFVIDQLEKALAACA